MKTVPNGVYPTMVTPFTEDYQVDYGALPALLRWYEERGVTGVFAICQSSEIFYLSFEERLQILREIMRAKQPGTVVLASGHTAYDSATQIREAQAFIAEGIDAYVFISNRFSRRRRARTPSCAASGRWPRPCRICRWASTSAPTPTSACCPRRPSGGWGTSPTSRF